MPESRFTSDWEERALYALESMVDLELEYESFSEFMRIQLRSDAESLSFLGDFILATCLLSDHNRTNAMPQFDAYCSSNPGIWDVFKHGVSFAQDVMRDVDFSVEENHHGDASLLHKAIAGMLIETLLSEERDARIRFSNEASELTLISDGSNLCLVFSLDGELDGGAQTLTTAFLNWMKPKDDSSARDSNYSNFVSGKYCAGLEVLYEFRRIEKLEVSRRITAFYRMFRSVSPLTIEFETKSDSPWYQVLNALDAQSQWLQMRVKPVHSVHPQNWSDF
jgi:hypothetical protein